MFLVRSLLFLNSMKMTMRRTHDTKGTPQTHLFFSKMICEFALSIQN